MVPLTPTDWKNGRGVFEVLEPFHTATKLEEGSSYLTLASVIPVLLILGQSTKSYFNDRNHIGYGITFARNILSSLENRFGVYPDYLELQPHCFATFTDPRFKNIYFSRKPEVETAKDQVLEWMKEEMRKVDVEALDRSNASESNGSKDNSFWSILDRSIGKDPQQERSSIESELHRCSGLSPLSRSTNPLHAIEALKNDYPRIYVIFRKYCVFPSTQNRDERIFSLVSLNTQARSWRIQVDTIEKKVVIGSAIRSNGFIFDYKRGRDSSSDDDD